MKLNHKTSWIIAAAIAGLPFFASNAFAQQRVGSDGHALDANNRVGSGGVNTAVANPSQSQSLGNQIVTDNTTGLFGFHGRVPYTAASAFRGVLPGEGIDQFNAVSSGVPGAAPAANYGNKPTPFYGISNTASPPQGYVQLNYGTGYVPATTTIPTSSDLRLDYSLNTSLPQLPAPGELNLPGQVDPTADRSLISASPLYGIRQWRTDGQGGTTYLFNSQNPTGPEDTATPTQNRVQEIQRELNQTIVPESNTPINTSTAATPGNASTITTPPGLVPSTAIQQNNLTPIAGNIATGQANRKTLPSIPPPGQQSAQYATLMQHLAAYDAGQPKTDEEANRQYQAALQQIRQYRAAQANAVAPGATTPAPGSKPITPQPLTPATPSTPGAQPVNIQSLGQGVRSKGLADLLTTAEDQIRHSQYDKATASYNEALKAAPNNPLILLGRAHANLASGNYRQAETDLRSAYQADHAVLLAQFNLADLFGDRLPAIVSDLKQIAVDSPKNPTPLFLLAYVSYNTGNPSGAATYLDSANDRAGGHDQVIALMKKYWSFTDKTPASTTQPSEMNK